MKRLLSLLSVQSREFFQHLFSWDHPWMSTSICALSAIMIGILSEIFTLNVYLSYFIFFLLISPVVFSSHAEIFLKKLNFLSSCEKKTVFHLCFIFCMSFSLILLTIVGALFFFFLNHLPELKARSSFIFNAHDSLLFLSFGLFVCLQILSSKFFKYRRAWRKEISSCN